MTVSQLSFDAVDSLITRKRWSPPLYSDFATATVQVFDQSLSNTGAVLLRSSGTGITLLATAMIRPPADIQAIKSYEGNCARADSLYAGLKRARTGYAAAADVVLYERPPVKGQRMESIIMAGREVHRVTNGSAILVDNRHAKAVIVGRAGNRSNPVTKAHVKEAVERYITPPEQQGKIMPWNEHTRDACLLALAWLYDEKRRQLQEQVLEAAA
ncbi:hypothetical protein E6R60_26380 [Streptomyces sp. A0642]|uniref:hypothetical protein n=1 Tax=Streptomyces sp. A0642 TaxID=2563100 RepID=UPI0010A24E25|nr:hypothetical protein [Streptomyces sp. A0642]THA72461.1 hypothetical protein E6R60_26380 [Streptomyces sp. A0642]